MIFTKSFHSFLAEVLRAVKYEHVWRCLTVSHEEFGLEFILREVFENDSWFLLESQWINQAKDLFFIVFALELVFPHESSEVNQMSICPMFDLLSNCSFTWCLWSNYKHDLWLNSFLGAFEDFTDIFGGINCSYFAKGSIIFVHWHRLVLIIA